MNLLLKKTFKHTIDCLIDVFDINSTQEQRVQESIEKAFALAKGLCKVVNRAGKENVFSSDRICLQCGTSFIELEPRLFSFNSPLGACEACHGLGRMYDWEAERDESWVMMRQLLAKEVVYRKTCSSCQGMRLKKEVLAVMINGKILRSFLICPSMNLMNF